MTTTTGGERSWRERAEVLAMAATTLPLSIAVTHAGLQCGIDPWVILLSSMSVFSAALQLLAYQLAAASGTSAMLWVTAALVPLRLLVYSIALGRHMAAWSLPRRLAALYLLTDISFFEFQRRLRHGADAALSRYTLVSRALWASWQVGTVVGLSMDGLAWPLPKEGIAVLVFACLALGQWGHDAAWMRRWVKRFLGARSRGRAGADAG